MTERAVPSDTLPASNVDKAANPFDEKGEKPDRFGEWLDDDARIWRVYERLAKQDDEEKVKRWSGGLTNLALFATLFAGITTAFIIESQKGLKRDYAELAYLVQIAISEKRDYDEKPFVVPGQARVVNCLWIASLLLSLSAALIAVMGQDWVEMYVDRPVCNPRQWAEIRSFRLKGVYRWYMPGVIATAPVLLHASFFLFGIGMAVFMSSDVITQNLCVALWTIVAFLYAGVMFSPVFWSSSPFRSPATMLMRDWFCASQRLQRKVMRYVRHHVDAARRWIQTRLSMHWAMFDIALEIFGPHVSNGCTAVFRRWPLQPRWATHDVGTPEPAAESQHTAPGSSSPIPAGPTVEHPWVDDFGRPALAWIKNCPPNLRTVFGRILEIYRPDISNGWSDISETPSVALVADSLSWLSSASSSPEVRKLVVAGLCDHVIGAHVAKHSNAQRLMQKLHQYADGNWEHMRVLDLSRYVIICANAGQRCWPPLVKQRFVEIIDTEHDIPQDFLLALVHLTSGFQQPPLRLRIPTAQLTESSDEMVSDNITVRYSEDFLASVCRHVRRCTPIALPTIVSIFAWPSSEPAVDGRVVALFVLINKWHDALPPDLSPLVQALREMLPNEAVKYADELTTLCQARVDLAADNILHLLIAFFSQSGEDNIACHAIRDLALSLTCDASNSGNSHTCLAVMFGNSDHRNTQAAWNALPAKSFEVALLDVCSGIRFHECHAALRPVLARMVTRCITPPHPLQGNISGRYLLSCGKLLFNLVDAMYGDPTLPDDLFRPVLESGDLAKLVASLPRGDSDGSLSCNFLYLLMAIARWITARSNFKDKQELFRLFTAVRTTPSAGSTVWDLVYAIGTVLETMEEEILGGGSFCDTAEKFMSVMTSVRIFFPGHERTLWADIAGKFGANKHRFGLSWLWMRTFVQDGTGIDPEEYATENLSRGAPGSATQGDDSGPGSSSRAIEPTNDGTRADTLAHPVPQISRFAAGATQEGSI